MRTWWYTFAAVVAVAAIAGVLHMRAKHHGPLPFDGWQAPTDRQKTDAKDIAAAVNDFAFKLAKTVAHERKGGNFLISPLSVSTAQSMLLAGLKGSVKTQLAGALGYRGLPDDAVQGGMFALNYEVQRAADGQFRTANAFAAILGFPVKQSFTQALKDHYNARVFTPLKGPGDLLDAVNAWASGATRGMIPRALDRVPADTLFVLLNASAFTAHWKTEFNPSETHVGPFTTDGGKVVQVPLMHIHLAPIRFNMTEEGAITAEIPYRDEEFALVVMLPAEGQNVWRLLDGLDARRWSTVLRLLRSEENPLILPRFTFDDSLDLRKPLESLGVSHVWVPSALQGISDRVLPNPHAADEHKTHIEVDEKGTWAAAEAAEVVGAIGVEATKAFVYAIVHQATGVIVFLGVCADPTQTHLSSVGYHSQ